MGNSGVSMDLMRSDLDLAFEDFAERYLRPAFENLKDQVLPATSVIRVHIVIEAVDEGN